MKNDRTSSPPGNKPSSRWGRGSAPRRQGSWSSPNVLQSLFHHKVFSFLIFFECLVTLGSKLTCALFKLWRILAPESQSSPALDNVVIVGEIMGIQANHIEWVTKTDHFLMKVSWGPMWVTSDYPIRAISLDVGGAKQGVERTSKYTCPNHSGYRRYLYHQGNEQTTGGTVEAAAKPRLIWRSAEIYFPGVSNLPLPPYHLILQ